MIPILPPSPKFLTLLAEKRSHIAVGHCCALFRHTLTIRHILKWDSLALSYLLTIKCIWKCPDKAFLSFSHVFFAYSLKLRLIVPERSNDPKKCPIQSQKPKFGLCGAFLRKVPKSKSGPRLIAPTFHTLVTGMHWDTL